MCADDKVIFSERIAGLQISFGPLNILLWNMEVTHSCCQVKYTIVLRKSGMIRKCKKWHINGSPLEIVDQFAHQALLLTANYSSLELRKKLLSEVERYYLYWKKNQKHVF